MESSSSSGSNFMTDSNLVIVENTQNTASKGGESKGSTSNDIGECGHSDVTDTNSSSYLAASQKVWGIDLASQMLNFNHNYVFHHYLIWENITDYLSISDLKELSLVNGHFLEKVRNISRFRSSAGQIVAGEMKIHTFNLCRAVVKVDTLDDKILHESAADIFQNIEYLELHNLFMPEVEETKNSRLIQIVANCPMLKSLAFEEIDYLCGNLEPFFTNENVKSVFSNLKELHIGIYKNYRLRNQSYDSSKIAMDEALQQTFKYFPDLQMKLTKFSYLVSDTGCNYDNYCFYPELLLRSSEESLEELKIVVDIKGFDELQIMQFPKLKKLHLILYEKPVPKYYGNTLNPYLADTLVPFLQAHLSTLREFVLESIDEYSLTPFCELFKSSKEIEVLQFTTRSSFGKSLRSTNWDFLAANLNFRDFKLCTEDAEKNYDSHIDIDTEEELEEENEEGQRIFIPRKNESYYFPKYLDAFPSTIESIEFGHSIRNYLIEIPTVIIMTSSLARLKNLTALKVKHCNSFLNDDIVQFICQHLTKLRIFEGDFTEVTDFGISGVRGSGKPDSGISLTNLKGLRKLTMSSSFFAHSGGLDCITWSGLHKAVRFLELVELKVERFRTHDSADAPKFPSSLEEKEKNKLNYLILINQNPSLEQVNIKICLLDTLDRKHILSVNTFSGDSPPSWYADMLKGQRINSKRVQQITLIY